jgi:hypothetical protein
VLISTARGQLQRQQEYKIAATQTNNQTKITHTNKKEAKSINAI